MSDAIARLTRLPPEERARFLAHLRASKLPGFAPVKSNEAPLVRRDDREGPTPASFAQEQLWFLTQLAPDVATYNVPFCFQLEGPLDVDALTAALAEIARRHEVLRTTLHLQLGRLVQVISPDVDATLPMIDLSDSPDAEAEAQARAAELARMPFNLSEGPLHRRLLLRLDRSGRKHVLVWVLSHAVVDGWSLGVLLRELAALYQSLHRGEELTQQELPLQFADYAIWQRKTLVGDRLEKLLAYWRHRVADCPVLRFPTDYPHPPVQTFRGATHIFPFPPSMAKGLTKLSRRLGATPFMVLVTAYQALLARYSVQDDIVIGTVVAGRPRPELESILGSFVNTVLLRTDLSGDPDFQELLERVRGVTTDAFAHQEVPFGKLVESLRPARSTSSNPFCKTVFTLGNTPLVDSEIHLTPGLTLTWSGIPNGTVRFDFELAIDEMPNGLRGRFDYNVDLFRPETAARFCDAYLQLLKNILENPVGQLSQLLDLPELIQERFFEPDSLPGPDLESGAENDNIPPRTPLEEKLAGIWMETLELSRVSVHDGFFALGGHSLMAAQLVARLRIEFEVDLSLQQFLEACTVAELAAVIDQLSRQPAVDEVTVLRLLGQVEQMSDAEVAEFLTRLGGTTGHPVPDPGLEPLSEEHQDKQ